MNFTPPLEHLEQYKVILASQSPRRQHLLKELGIDYEIRLREVEEVFPTNLPAVQVAEYLSKIKAEEHHPSLSENELLITADTTVVLDNAVINKPVDRTDAESMLLRLSCNTHTVVTGVCITTKTHQLSFSEATRVYFKKLGLDEINYYLDTYKPFDKSGSYGIQEWIGYIGIEKIEGDFFNVMGFPLFRLYQYLNRPEFH